jgi:hypothetical protein
MFGKQAFICISILSFCFCFCFFGHCLLSVPKEVKTSVGFALCVVVVGVVFGEMGGCLFVGYSCIALGPKLLSF